MRGMSALELGCVVVAVIVDADAFVVFNFYDLCYSWADKKTASEERERKERRGETSLFQEGLVGGSANDDWHWHYYCSLVPILPATFLCQIRCPGQLPTTMKNRQKNPPATMHASTCTQVQASSSWLGYMVKCMPYQQQRVMVAIAGHTGVCVRQSIERRQRESIERRGREAQRVFLAIFFINQITQECFKASGWLPGQTRLYRPQQSTRLGALTAPQATDRPTHSSTFCHIHLLSFV